MSLIWKQETPIDKLTEKSGKQTTDNIPHPYFAKKKSKKKKKYTASHF